MTRPLAGRIAKASGAALESLAELHHARARALGIASVRKVSPDIAILRRHPDGSFLARWRGKSGCDYRGIVCGGRALAIEAKSTAAGNLTRSEFNAAEVLDLDECAALGGLAIVLWYRRDTGSLYAIPWAGMPWKKSGRGQSVRVEDVAGWRVVGVPYLNRFIDPSHDATG